MALVDYKDASKVFDPERVELVAYIDEYLNNQRIQRRFLKTKTCEERDFEDFYPISGNEAAYLYELRANRVLQCIDADEILIRGNSEINGLQFNIDFRQCVPDDVTGKKCKKQTLAQLQDHLTYPELVVLHNTQRIDLNLYDEAVLKKESKLFTQHVDKRQANWMQTFINNNELLDAISYLNYGNVEDRRYFTYKPGKLGLSYADNFETGTYKIAGFSVMRNLDYTIVSRSVYDFLAFIGDVGGLEGILFLVSGSIIAPMVSYMFVFRMMPFLFYQRKNQQSENLMNQGRNYLDLGKGKVPGPRDQQSLRYHIESALNNR